MLKMATLACLGGMFYRFIPPPSHLSPHIALDIFCSAGSADGDWLHFARHRGLPSCGQVFRRIARDIKDWNHMFRSAPWRRPTAQPGQNVKSNPPKENKHGRISIDPITRIEVTCASTSKLRRQGAEGMGELHMWRTGNHSPRTRRREGWVFAQRFCESAHGPCHCFGARGGRCASTRDSGERPVHPQPDPHRTRLARHIVHFYQLSALDWVDITTIPKADPARAASIAEGYSTWRKFTPRTGGSAEQSQS